MSAEPVHVDVIDELRAVGIDVPNTVDEDETAGEILSDVTTLSIHDAQEERDTFLPHDFDYVPSRDLTFDSQNLFTYLIEANVLNPMSSSTNVDLPSFKHIFLDLLSSKHSWCDAIEKQKMISIRNKDYLINLNKSHLKDIYSHIRNPDMIMNQDLIAKIKKTYVTANAHLHHFKFLTKFIEKNHDLLEIHEGDADEPFDIFQVKLPLWYINADRGDYYTKWVSLYKILTDSTIFNENNKASPTLPYLDKFSCTRYLRKIFDNSTIARNTFLGDQPDRSRHTNLSSHNIPHIRSCIAVGTNENCYKNWLSDEGIYLGTRGITNYTEIGKTRYTLSLILRWTELTHKFLFQDQISHSILYHFYRNIRTAPRRYLSKTPKRYINANIRTLAKDSMPDEKDDPVLLITFKEGQDVYKMKCCHKDLSMEGILGIIQSGRTPMCPMCRAPLFTADEKCATDPTYKEPEMIEIPPDQLPSYILNPIIPPSSYARNLLTLE